MGVQMTLLQSFLGFKKVKESEFLASEIEKLEKMFESDFSALGSECEAIIDSRRKEHDSMIMAFEKSKKKLELAQYEIDELQRLTDDKKDSLEKKNKELAQQIRLIEAKASPDQVWISAFQSGFSKAWGMMKPVMYEGFDKVKQEISDNAKMETLNGLQSVLRGKDGFDPETH
jgi:DNA repair exonuclease SbcCD ATPase subunit